MRIEAEGAKTPLRTPRQGADVAINYYPSEEPDAQDVAEIIKSEGRKAVLIPGDITDQQFCIELVERSDRELGGLDILVNNAAYQRSKESIADISFESSSIGR